MATAKTYFARQNHRFITVDHHSTSSLAPDSGFEFDESDIYSLSSIRSSETPPEFIANPAPTSRINKKAASKRVAGGPSSLPVNVPDWSKILKSEYRDNRRNNSDDEDDYGSEGGVRIPPHEFLASQIARSGMASFSVHEGIGRTLKGRDLSRVRNAIWAKTGFQD